MSNDNSDEHGDEIAAEVDFSQGVRGKHYHAYREGSRVIIRRKDGTVEERDFVLPEGTVVLDPDVREHFPDSESVNRALRGLLDLVPHR